MEKEVNALCPYCDETNSYPVVFRDGLFERKEILTCDHCNKDYVGNVYIDITIIPKRIEGEH